MYTRKQYLAHDCTHREYYSQFVSKHLVTAIGKWFGLAKLVAHFDSELGDKDYIQLIEWEQIRGWVASSQLSLKLREHGDYLSLAGQVCILKEAARQYVEQNKN